MWSRYLNVTDIQTDRQTTCNLIIALCIASCGKKKACLNGITSWRKDGWNRCLVCDNIIVVYNQCRYSDCTNGLCVWMGWNNSTMLDSAGTRVVTWDGLQTAVRHMAVSARTADCIDTAWNVWIVHSQSEVTVHLDCSVTTGFNNTPEHRKCQPIAVILSLLLNNASD